VAVVLIIVVAAGYASADGASAEAAAERPVAAAK
jgi:hypothetical protein